MSIGKRIKELRKDLGLTQTEFAQNIYRDKSTISKIENEELDLSSSMRTAICKEFGVREEWILTGEGEKFDKERISDENDPKGEFVYVPQVSGKISAGGGLVPENHIEMRIAFRRAWIMKRGDPKNMALIKVSGDSMEPTLQSGDLVLVDHSRDYLDPHGGIYAVAVDDTIMIKRLQPEYPNKKVQIISDNPKYKVMEAQIEQIHINGKVIWFGREIER